MTKQKTSPLKTMFTDGSNLNLVTDKKHPLYNPRAEEDVDKDLVARLLRFGWTHGALKAVEEPNEEGLHDVIAGRRRTKALWTANAKLKAEGKPPILALVILASKQESDNTPEGNYLKIVSMFQDNHGSKEDGVLLEAQIVHQLLLKGEEAGLKKEQILKDAMVVLGVKSIDTVKNRLKVLKVLPAAREAFKEGKITGSDLFELARMAPENQEKAFKAIPQKKPEEGEVRRKKGKKPGDRKQGDGKKRPTAKVLARYLEVMGDGHKGALYLRFAAGLISEGTFQKKTGIKL